MSRKEYAIQKRKTIVPVYYTWDYCIKNKIPYVVVSPKNKYSSVSYDLLSIHKGLTFDNENSFIDHMLNIYNDYINLSSFPIDKKKFIGGRLNGFFIVFKEDQEKIAILLLDEIEKHINKYGKIDQKHLEYFNNIEKINKQK